MKTNVRLLSEIRKLRSIRSKIGHEIRKRKIQLRQYEQHLKQVRRNLLTPKK